MPEDAFFCFQSPSEASTRLLGFELGRLLVPGTVLALVGELGSGKTRFVQGLAKGLGVPPWERISSPSFALIHEYHGGRLPLYHVDLYRLPEGVPDPELGLEDYLYGEGVCAIEWAERWLAWLPQERLELEFAILGRRSRQINLKAFGEKCGGVLVELNARLGPPGKGKNMGCACLASGQ